FFRNRELVKEILPVPFANNCYPLYSDDSVLFFYRNTNSGYLYNKRNRNLKPIEKCGKWVFHVKDKFVHIHKYGGGILVLSILNDKEIKTDWLILGSDIIQPMYSPFDENIYLLGDDDILYKFDATNCKTVIAGHVPAGHRPLGMCYLDNYIGILTNTNELIIYDIASNYKRTIIPTAGVALYKLEP